MTSELHLYENDINTTLFLMKIDIFKTVDNFL